jgi:hypothetical protein
VEILHGSRDSTPNVIEQVAGYRLGDAGCDNGLFATDIEEVGLGILP